MEGVRGAALDVMAPLRPRKRSRRSKLKSTVSVRLNPDFNIKNFLVTKPAAPQSQMDRKLEELDPKTMEFDSLAELLHPSFICDYLQKIHLFLKSDQREMCFPNLAPYKEAFLVKLVQVKANLMSRVFNETSACLGRQILDILEKNRDLYRWTHSYEDERSGKRVLVYKKIDVKNLQNGHTDALQSSNSTQKPTTSMEVDVQSTDTQIPTSFRISSLNTILRFIRDGTQPVLVYPEIPIAYALFIHSALNEPYTSEVGMGFKSLYARLYNTLANYQAEFDLNTRLFETKNKDTLRVILEKIPKNVVEADANTKTPQSMHEERMLIKAQKEYRARQELSVSLSDRFMQDCLTQVLAFMEDNYRASLQFQDVTTKESKFIQSVTAISRAEDQYKFYSDETVVMMKKVARSYHRDTWKMKVEVGKLNKMTGRRTVTLSKTPVFKEDTAKDKRPEPPPVSNKNVDEKPISESTPTKTVLNEKIDDSQHNNKITKTDTISNDARQISKNKETKSRQSLSIAFESAGAQIIDNGQVTSDGTSEVTASGDTGKKWANVGRVGKLLEAMSVPLESNIAEKMMRRMGWAGGALGARGEGITEPILPALHLAPGAGLGHVKQSQTHSAAEFRLKLLSNLLTFIQTNSSETTISFAQPLSKREQRFLKPTMVAFNERRPIGLGRTEELSLVRSIIDVLCADKQVLLEYRVGDDKKEIHFTKTVGAAAVSKPSRKKKKRSKTDLNTSVTKLPFPDSYSSETLTPERILSLNETYNLENLCPTTKAAKALAYRIIFLEKIKEFLTLNDNVAEFKFDCVLNTKQRNFVQNVVTDVNKRSYKRKYSALENDIYKEIRSVAGDCFLTVAFSGQKFILQKKYYQKRFTNSATDLPPPKSKDLANTIIYTTNGVIKHDEDKPRDDDVTDSIDVASSDDDVLIIDVKHDIIDLTDDEEMISSVRIRTYETDDSCRNNGEVSRDKDISENMVDKNQVTDKNGHESDGCEENDTSLPHDEDLMETDLEWTKDDLSLDISNESMLLDMLEKENNSIDNVDTKAAVENDSEKRGIVKIKIEVNNNLNFENRNERNMDLDCSNASFKENSRSESPNSQTSEKVDQKVIYVSIVPSDKEINLDIVKDVQNLISNSINENDFLPRLKCHGVKNGGLIYSCHCERSRDWLKSALSVANFKVSSTNYRGDRELIMKIGSFIPVNLKKVFRMIELYNPNLNTVDWVISNENVFENYITFTVHLDKNSYEYILQNNLSLFYGIDKVDFAYVWV